MRRPLLVPSAIAAAAAIAALAAAQTAPRAPIVRVQTPVPAPAPTPTPVPDPTGVYQGNAQFTVSGLSGTFNQTWKVSLQAQPCSDCDPGVYYLRWTGTETLLYQTGELERGGVYGYLIPSGTLLDLYMGTGNCPFVRGDTQYSGYLWGGAFGPAPGSRLRISGNTLSGRLSGRDCFARLVTADVSLQRVSSSTLSCSSLRTGGYAYSWASSCGASGSGQVTLYGDGCTLSAVIPNLVAVEGVFTGATTLNVRVKNLPPCGGTSATGTANYTPSTGALSGIASGTIPTSQPGCCPAGPYSFSFSLTPSG